jgi:hypothetical protein
MAAPERFAESQICSCTAGTVHTWPISTNRIAAKFRSLWEAQRTLAAPTQLPALYRLTHLCRARLSIVAAQFELRPFHIARRNSLL